MFVKCIGKLYCNIITFPVLMGEGRGKGGSILLGNIISGDTDSADT